MNWCHAIAYHSKHWLARARLALPDRRDRRPRDQAFVDYFRRLIPLFQQRPRALEVLGKRVAIHGRRGPAHELRLRTPPGLASAPGDMLYIMWRNRAETVAEIERLLGPSPAPSWRAWTDAAILHPPRLLQATPRELLESVLDLERPSRVLLERAGLPRDTRVSLVNLLRAHPALATWAELAQRQSPIHPRVYTLSRTGAELELLVSTFTEAPGRCSTHLAALEPGEAVHAWLLPHPHRLPTAHGHEGPGLVIVTGTAIATPLSYLRAGVLPSGTRVIWGLRSRQDAPELIRELESAPGLDLQVTESAASRHVQDALDPAMPVPPWIYLSGHRQMAEEVETALETAWGHDEVHRWQDEMRFIRSASG
jgi:sulfite reductase alpha subunit-like flavoprotein